MRIKDSLNLCLVGIVDDTKESGHVYVRIVLPVRVGSSCELIIDLLTFFTTLPDREQVDHVVWSWVLYDKLAKT